jgi:uncharacterized protein (TIGR03083 family)
VLSYEDYGAGLGAAGTVLRANAISVGLDAPVPTCPGWTMRDLVVHQGMVHRWAIDVLDGRGYGSGARHEAAGRAAVDLLDWFDDGWAELLSVLGGAPADLDVPFFLRTGMSPRDGWARRQCHETSIHAVDALAARLGRTPTVAETWLKPDLATDGVDELLRGYVPRKRQGKLRSATPMILQVSTTDTEAHWWVKVTEEPAVTEIGVADSPDVRISGPAVDLYLALWNRSEASRDARLDPAGFLEQWRRQVAIVWM